MAGQAVRLAMTTHDAAMGVRESRTQEYASVCCTILACCSIQVGIYHPDSRVVHAHPVPRFCPGLECLTCHASMKGWSQVNTAVAPPSVTPVHFAIQVWWYGT